MARGIPFSVDIDYKIGVSKLRLTVWCPCNQEKIMTKIELVMSHTHNPHVHHQERYIRLRCRSVLSHTQWVIETRGESITNCFFITFRLKPVEWTGINTCTRGASPKYSLPIYKQGVSMLATQLAVLMWDYVTWRPSFPQLIPNASYCSSYLNLCICI